MTVDGRGVEGRQLGAAQPVSGMPDGDADHASLQIVTRATETSAD